MLKNVSTVYVCDRCGEEVLYPNTIHVNGTMVELCDDCAEKYAKLVDEFMRNESGNQPLSK